MRIDNDLSLYSFRSALLGFISLFLWLIPPLALGTSLYAFKWGMKGIESKGKNFSLAGVYFSSLSFTLSVAYSAYAFYAS